MAQKLSFLLRRRPELSREEFQRTWLEDHAPLVRERAEAMGCSRYVQVHTELDAAARPGRPEPYDGVAELWFDRAKQTGTAEDGAQAGRELLEDERRFIELSESPIFMGEERAVIEDGTGPRRLVYPLRRRPELSAEEFYTYWSETHGPLIRELAPPRFQRYAQVHTHPKAAESGARAARGAPPPYDGIATLWIDDALPGWPEQDRERISALIQEDEAKFIDHSQSPIWFGVEHVIVGR